MTAPLSSYIDGFLVARRYAQASRKQRSAIIHRFCRTVGDPAPEDLTPALCLQWWADHADRRPATASSYYKAVRQFLIHLRDIEVMPVDRDPLRAIRPPGDTRGAPRILSPLEVQAVWDACRTPVDRCIVALMLGCGLRSVDVARLRIEDIALEDQLMVVRGKGEHRDLLPIPTSVATVLDDYLVAHPAESGPLARHPIDFHPADLAGAPMDALAVQWRVRKLIGYAGVKRHAHDGRGGHALRRTFASTLLDNGATIREVQSLLRHQSLSATERYLRRPEAHEMRSLVEHSPLSQLDRTIGATEREHA